MSLDLSQLQRISVKYFVHQPEHVDLPAFVPIFQRWIRERAVEGLLIDVADYKHVPDGPGVILIGHEADYSIDLKERRPGLLYTRKRQLSADLRDTIRTAIRLALAAAQKLEAEPQLAGRITFDPSEAVVTFLDRLHAPNHPDTFIAVRDDIRAVISEFYGAANAAFETVYTDQRFPLAVRVTVPEVLSISALLSQSTISDGVGST